MNSSRIVWLLVALAILPGCAGNEASPEGATAAPAEATARTLPIPGEGMPEGHPPIDGSAGSAAPAAGGALTWATPAGWIEEAPASSMRQAQYRVPGAGGEGECLVFYFGPGQGGDPMANAVRWAGQFAQPDGSPSREAMQTEKLDGAPLPVTLVEVTGTYDGGMTMTAAPAEKMAGYMLLGGIAETADGPWFFKLTGPESTVREQREAFVGMLRSLAGSD